MNEATRMTLGPIAFTAFLLLNTTALSQQLIWTEHGPQDNVAFGFNVEGMPDLDGDGWPDLMVAAQGYDNAKGAVFLYSGRSGVLIQTFVGEKIGDNLMKMSAVGDVTGDGIPEFLLGAVNGSHNNSQSGRVYLYDGATLQVLHRWDGEDRTNRYAWVEGTGDLDGDGWPDYFITAGTYTWWSPWYARGKIYAYSGRTHHLLYTLLGEAEYDTMNVQTHLGDIDGDGVPDLLAGSGHDANGINSGRAYLYSGHDGRLIYKLDGQSAGELFSFSADQAGDVDRDGVTDFVIGAPWRGAGTAELFSGATGAVIYQWASDGTVSEFGREVAGGADVNGDGWPDVAIGAPNGSPPAVFLYSGRTGTLLYRFDAPSNQDRLGEALAFVGDVSGDDRPELLVGGSFGFSGGKAPGQVFLFAGNDLYLQATFKPRRQRLVLETRGGPPRAPAFVSWRLRPTDFWTKVQVGRLNKNGEWKATLEVPPSLLGLTIECQSFARSDRTTGDRWLDSAVTEVLLQ